MTSLRSAETANLDAAELTQMALNASQHNDSGAAIGYLKQAVALDGNAALAHYLLGAEYAQISMIDLAIAEMQCAVEADPALSIARFQLGLLFLTSARVEEAIRTWQPLAALGADHPLFLFQAGLVHLSRDEFVEAKVLLQEGQQRNTDNAPLNTDMQKVIDEIDKAIAQATKRDGETLNDSAAEADHVLLSAYKR